MRAVVRDRLEDVDSGAWDELRMPSPYFTSGWLRARADSVRGVLRIVEVRDDDDRLVLGVPCFLTDKRSHPRYDLAGVVAEWDDAALDGAGKQLRPSVVVAAPSLAGGVVEARDLSPERRAVAIEQAVGAVEELAVAAGASSVGWMYLPEGEDPQLERQLRRRRYHAAIVEASCRLPIVWRDFDGYLASLTPSGRRHVRKERRSVEDSGVEIESGGADLLDDSLVPLEREWRLKYGRGASREGVERDHDALREHVGPRIRVFVARAAGRPLGFAAFVEHETAWHSRFMGFDYAASPPGLHFAVVFYAPIDAAIARGVQQLDYSIEGYEAKHRRGCHLHPVRIFVKVPTGIEPAVHVQLAALNRRRSAALTGFR